MVCKLAASDLPFFNAILRDGSMGSVIMVFLVLKVPSQWESWTTNWCFWRELSLIPLVYQGGSSTGKEATGVPLKDMTYLTVTQTSTSDIGVKLLPSDKWKVNYCFQSTIGSSQMRRANCLGWSMPFCIRNLSIVDFGICRGFLEPSPEDTKGG